MAGETAESTKLGTSMDNRDFMELVWENGQILLRGPSQQVKKDDKILTKKTSTLGSTVDELAKRENYNCPQEYDHYPDHLWFGLYDQTTFNLSRDENDENNSNHITDSHVVPVHKDADLPPPNTSDFVEETAHQLTPINGQLHQFPLQRQSPPLDSKKGSLPNLKFQRTMEQSGLDKHTNFSFFWRSARNKASSRNHPVNSSGMESTSGSKSAKGLQNPQNKMKKKRPIAKPSAADEQSEAFAHDQHQVLGSSPSSLAANLVKVNLEPRKCSDRLAAATSTSSRGASNNPTYNSFKTGYEGTEEEPCASDNVEENEDGERKASQHVGRSMAGKRKRIVEAHNLSEKIRRNKISKKICVLKDLIPNSTKVDKASILDETIRYIKALQLQMQIMSMSIGLCMPPMMLPIGMQHINTPSLDQLSGMGMEMMGLRSMQMGVGCSPSPFSASAMVGFPGQMLSVPRPPFMSPFIGGPSTNPIPVPGLATAAELLPFFNKMNAVRNSNSEMVNPGSSSF